MNLQARLYDPVIGRFLSVDPLAEIQIGITPYHYCGNDPVNAKDPSGLFQDPIELKREAEHNSSELAKMSMSIYKTNSEFWYGFQANYLNGIMRSLERYRDLADGGRNSMYTDLFNSMNCWAGGVGGSFIGENGSVSVRNYHGVAHIKGNGQDCLVTQIVSLCNQAGLEDIGYENITSILDKRSPEWRDNGSNVYDIMFAVSIYYPKVKWGYLDNLSSDAIIEQLSNNRPLLGRILVSSGSEQFGHAVTITGYDTTNGFTYFDGNTGSYNTINDLNGVFTPYIKNNDLNIYFLYINSTR